MSPEVGDQFVFCFTRVGIIRYFGVSATPSRNSLKFDARATLCTMRLLPCFSNSSSGKPRRPSPSRIFHMRGFTPSPKIELTFRDSFDRPNIVAIMRSVSLLN